MTTGDALKRKINGRMRSVSTSMAIAAFMLFGVVMPTTADTARPPSSSGVSAAATVNTTIFDFDVSSAGTVDTRKLGITIVIF